MSFVSMFWGAALGAALLDRLWSLLRHRVAAMGWQSWAVILAALVSFRLANLYRLNPYDWEAAHAVAVVWVVAAWQIHIVLLGLMYAGLAVVFGGWVRPVWAALPWLLALVCGGTLVALLVPAPVAAQKIAEFVALAGVAGLAGLCAWRLWPVNSLAFTLCVILALGESAAVFVEYLDCQMLWTLHVPRGQGSACTRLYGHPLIDILMPGIILAGMGGVVITWLFRRA